MRSTVSIKGMILALVIFFIGIIVLGYLTHHRHKITKKRKGAREVSSLNERVEKTMLELNKIREEIERANKEEVNVDYFKRHQIPPEQRTPTFLAKVNDVVEQLGITTRLVKPMPQEESPEYVRYPFLVETKSKYEEIVKFIDSLENSLGLNLDDLHVENDPKDPLWHRLKFTVSTFELKRPEPSASEEMAKGEGSPIEVMVRDDIAVERDPFLEKEKKVARPLILKKEPKRPPRLKLNGIIHIGSTKVAIINEEDVKEGDWVTAKKGKRTARYRILEIRENEVIADYKGEKYTFKLEPLVQTKKPSVKTQKR